MESGDMVLGVFSNFSFKLWDIREEFWGMDGHQGECMIGSLVNLERSGKSSVAKNGNG